MSDILFGARGISNERVAMDCTPDRSSCTATWRGNALTADGDDLKSAGGEGEGTPYLSLDTWDHMQFGVVRWELEDGARGKVAIIRGIRHSNSLDPRGAARWIGEMVALDHDDRLIHGDAELSIPDLSDPATDVTLTPAGLAAMTWQAIPVSGGGFRHKPAPDNHIEGQFYGRYAQEVGGIFERNRMVGAFGSKR